MQILHVDTLLGCSQPRALADATPGPGRLLTGEMSPREAALAAEMLGVRLAVACHYLETSDPDVAEFLRLVPDHDTTGARVALALQPGQGLTVDQSSHQIISPSGSSGSCREPLYPNGTT